MMLGMNTLVPIQRVADLVKLVTERLGLKIGIEVKLEESHTGDDDVPVGCVLLDGGVMIYPARITVTRRSLLGETTEEKLGWKLDTTTTTGGSYWVEPDVDYVEVDQFETEYQVVDAAIKLIVNERIDGIINAEHEATTSVADAKAAEEYFAAADKHAEGQGQEMTPEQYIQSDLAYDAARESRGHSRLGP